MDCLWRLLLEYAQAGRDLPSTDQHDIIPVGIDDREDEEEELNRDHMTAML